jgi:hypothetical protein
MKIPSIFLLIIGCLWALLVTWLFLGLSAISAPVSVKTVVVYYGGLSIGPLLLIVASALLLTGTLPKLGVYLACVGCVILTGFVLYQAWSVLQPPKPLEFRPLLLYIVNVVLLVVMVVADLASYKLFRWVNLNSFR